MDHLRTRTAGNGAPAAAGGQLRRGRGHPGEQRGPRPALLQGAAAAGGGPGELALAHPPDAGGRGRGEARAWARDGKGLDALLGELARKLPRLAGVREAAPPASFRLDGQKVPRQSARYTGRTSMTANLDVHEPGPPADPDSPLSFSMEGYPGRPPAALRPRLWAPGWNSVQALTRGPWEESGPGVLLLRPQASGPGAPAAYPEKAPEPRRLTRGSCRSWPPTTCSAPRSRAPAPVPPPP